MARLVEPAAQPDIVRSAQKDAYYVNRLAQACQEAVTGALGPRFSLTYSREIRAAADAIYYACTNGAGLQTLGEEFCDLIQVTGPGWDQTPGALRRILHVILRVVVPYVTDKYGARLEGLTPADVLGTEGDTDADASTNGPQPSSTSSSDTQLRAQSGSQASTSSTTASPGASIVTRVRTAWRHVLRRLRPLIAFLMRFLPPLKQVLGVILRMHLTVFYLNGWYYHISKRAADIKYLFVGRMLEPRPHYRVLGWMAVTQLGLGAATYVASTLLPWISLHSQSQQAAPRALPSPADPSLVDAVAVLSQGKPPQPNTSAASAVGQKKSAGGGADEPNLNSTCPLCLSAKRIPSCPPCGHVYCWRCITEWTMQRAECSCPVCRAPFKPNELCAIYGAQL